MTDADAEEQRRELVDDGDLDPETVAGRSGGSEAPLEVSEGDLADQAVEVPDDDEFDRG